MNPIDRRAFLKGGVLGAGALATGSVSSALGAAPAADAPARAAPGHAVAIASGNGLSAVERAVDLMQGGSDPAVAAVEGVAINEDDPDDMTVGFGGLPNEDGVVQLDAAVMHGPTHKAGAVAGLEGIRHPSRVALEVLRRTNHALLVGDGAKRFALRMGFTEEDLLTERAREAWLRWRANLNPDDDWLDDEQLVDLDARRARARESSFQRRPDGGEIPWSTGTIHLGAVTASGAVAACTTTSGLSYKIAGRVGDSPIVGAGLFVDQEVGCAGATGRGESMIKSCGAFQVVRHMEEGAEPTEACLRLLRWIASRTKRARLRNEAGEPNFDVTVYALRLDGAFGSATMRGGRSFAVCDRDGARLERAAVLYA